MACRGVYFALTDDEARRLLESASNEDVINFIQEEIEARWDEEWLQEADKSWDAIHRCLTDGTLRCRGASPLEKFVLGGKRLCYRSDYIVSYLTPDEVREIAKTTQGLTKEWFRQRYFKLKRTFLGMDVSRYDGPITETDFEYSWSYFEEIRQFFQKAAAAVRSVVFTVDQ